MWELQGKGDVFVEPSTGRQVPPQKSSYGTVEALWNADSYWVNLQLDASGAVAPAAACAFNLADTSAWQAFRGGASGAGPFRQQGPMSGMMSAFHILVTQVPGRKGVLLVVCHKLIGDSSARKLMETQHSVHESLPSPYGTDNSEGMAGKASFHSAGRWLQASSLEPAGG